MAVQNHLVFWMETSLTWVHTCRLEKAPNRRHAVKERNHFAFSDARRLVAQAVLDENFTILCLAPRKPVINSLAAVKLMRMAAWDVFRITSVINYIPLNINIRCINTILVRYTVSQVFC